MPTPPAPSSPSHPTLAHPLAAPLLAGNRRALARAITLAESSKPAHEAEAQLLLGQLAPHAGHALRIGLTGPPGVGKSTFIEALGLWLVEAGHRVAVLAVDPSSARTGGSIMGDKTRMQRLSMHPNAFIRPSPSGGTLGGVARRTREAALLCAAAGYDILLIETVGVGQSETQVAGMTDLFVLLAQPNAGDDLQGIKRGIMEMCDIAVVNKADTDPKAANRTQSQLTGALALLSPHSATQSRAEWRPRVLQVSSTTGAGIKRFWANVQEFRVAVDIEARRQRQTSVWLEDLLREAAWQRFAATHAAALAEARAVVAAGQQTPVQAVQSLLAIY